MSDKTGTTDPAVEGDGENDIEKVREKLKAEKVKRKALEEQVKALKAETEQRATALEEAMTFVREGRASQAVAAKISALVAEDKTMGAQMRAVITRAVEEQKLTDVNVVEVTYYKLRAQQAELLVGAAANHAGIPGFGHVNVEEFTGRNAGATAGQGSADPSDPKPAPKQFSALQSDLRLMMGRMSYAPDTHDSPAK